MSDLFGADAWRGLAAHWDALRRIVAFSAPLTSLPTWMAPALALGAILALALAAGIALLSLGTLLTALLIAHLLLEQVFGLRVELAPLQ